MMKRLTVVALAFVALAGAAQASPHSQALIKQGQAALAAKDYANALAKFRAAETADPKDANAFFFEGATLNRTGDVADAQIALKHAQSLGSRQPDLLFELGWSEVLPGPADDAVKNLEAYEHAHPNRGLTSELLGRAYARSGQYDAAVAKLKEAMARDPRLTGNALFYLAIVEKKRGNLDAARGYLAQLQQAAPDSQGVKVLQTALAGGK
ncbi:MAG: tetratricopeptide repeat protein [Alphaproteobacteria bacterium]|nr:tetratricopeptide repeat protein [Alphaproteobacteria bacterium]